MNDIAKLTCKEASRLLSQSQEGELSAAQKSALRLHLSLCAACTRFGAQLDALRAAMHRFRS